MKTLLLIFCLLITGCVTTSELPEPPDRGAVYCTADETYIVENITEEEFIREVIDNKEIIQARYKNTKLEWTE